MSQNLAEYLKEKKKLVGLQYVKHVSKCQKIKMSECQNVLAWLILKSILQKLFQSDSIHHARNYLLNNDIKNVLSPNCFSNSSEKQDCCIKVP